MIAITLALLAQASFARVITGQEAKDIREALAGDLENKSIRCTATVNVPKSIFTMKAVLKQLVNDTGLQLSIDDNLNQPVIKITNSPDDGTYTASFFTSEDYRSVRSFKLESFTSTETRVNTGTLVKPVFINRKNMIPYYLGTCEIY